MTIAEYYTQTPSQARKQLAALRTLVRSALPDAEEKISYQIPHFYVGGKRVVAIGGWKEHVALYPLSGQALEKYSGELAALRTSRGTVQFPLDQKLPEDLIRKIVRDRLAA